MAEQASTVSAVGRRGWEKSEFPPSEQQDFALSSIFDILYQ